MPPHAPRPASGDGVEVPDRRQKPLRAPGWIPEHDVLADHDPDLALLAWRVLREVRLWTDTPVAERGELGGSLSLSTLRRGEQLALAIPRLRRPLFFLRLLRTAPGRLQAHTIARAARILAGWFGEQGMLMSAAALAEAAARQRLDDPALANFAGRATRRAMLTFRAEVWFDRAKVLAVHQHNRRELIWALLGRGVLFKMLGRLSEAEALFEKAAKRAVSNRRNRLAGMAHHELLAIAAERGIYKAGERHVLGALANYPIQHVAYPNLVQDFVALLMRVNLFAEAHTLLRALVPHVKNPAVRALAWSAKARAAGALRLTPDFEEAGNEALTLLPEAKEFAAAIYVNIAAGARGLGRIEDAKSSLSTALPLARARKDAVAEQATAKLQLEIAEGRCPPVAADPPAGNQLIRVVREMLARFKKREASAKRDVKSDPEATGRIERPLAS